MATPREFIQCIYTVYTLTRISAVMRKLARAIDRANRIYEYVHCIYTRGRKLKIYSEGEDEDQVSDTSYAERCVYTSFQLC